MKKTALSHSRVQVFRDCHKKYFWRYVQAIARRRFAPAALTFGKAWHSWLESYHTDGGPPERGDPAFRELDDSDFKRIAHMAFGYFNTWNTEYGECQTDVELWMPIRNPESGRPSRSFTFIGYVDMFHFSEDGYHTARLFEHKTASMITGNYLEKLWNDAQLTGYCALAKANQLSVNECVYDVVKKSRIRQKKNESDVDFWARHAALYSDNSEGMYHRESLHIGADQIKSWERDLWQTTQEILTCQRLDTWPRNTGRCYDYHSECEFAPLCQNADNPILIDNEYEPRKGREPNDAPVNKPVF